jgi:hypothetical protein
MARTTIKSEDICAAAEKIAARMSAEDETRRSLEAEQVEARQNAIQLIMSAFLTAAPQRVNTPELETWRSGLGALRALGVETFEIGQAMRTLGGE